jgi:hypothetical protein
MPGGFLLLYQSLAPRCYAYCEPCAFIHLAILHCCRVQSYLRVTEAGGRRYCDAHSISGPSIARNGSILPQIGSEMRSTKSLPGSNLELDIVCSRRSKRGRRPVMKSDMGSCIRGMTEAAPGPSEREDPAVACRSPLRRLRVCGGRQWDTREGSMGWHLEVWEVV